MKKNNPNITRERINSVGFFFVYFLSTYLGSVLLFIWLTIVSALLNDIPMSLFSVKQDPPGFPTAMPTTTPTQLMVAGIGMIFLIPIVIFLGSVFVSKIRSVRLFATLTFITILLTHIQVFPGFFAQHHHVNNPFFYFLVGFYLLAITTGLTYLWKTLILENVNTDLPWKTYVLSPFVFIPIFYFVIMNLGITTYVPFGDYLFKNFVVNIYFLDWSGYFGLWLIISMLTTLTIVTKLLQKRK